MSLEGGREGGREGWRGGREGSGGREGGRGVEGGREGREGGWGGCALSAARSSNRFRALENVNGSAKEESESSANINTTIEDAVKTAMEEAVASTNGSRTKKAGQKVNVSKSDLAMIGEIVAQVMLGVQPLITSVVTSAVTASTRAILADVAESHTQLRNEVASLQKEVRLHRFQLDRLEQYGRRDSVRIHGLAETAGEPETAEGSTEKVISLAADMGVTLKPDDISISHRLPAPVSVDR